MPPWSVWSPLLLCNVCRVDALIALTRVFAEVCLGWGWLAGIPVLVAYPRLVTAC